MLAPKLHENWTSYKYFIVSYPGFALCTDGNLANFCKPVVTWHTHWKTRNASEWCLGSAWWQLARCLSRSHSGDLRLLSPWHNCKHCKQPVPLCWTCRCSIKEACRRCITKSRRHFNFNIHRRRPAASCFSELLSAFTTKIYSWLSQLGMKETSRYADSKPGPCAQFTDLGYDPC